MIGYNPLLSTLIKSSGAKTVGLVSPYANPTPKPLGTKLGGPPLGSRKKIYKYAASFYSWAEQSTALGGPPPGSCMGSFFCGTPTEKASREGQRFRKTEVAESPIPSHTDVVADHSQRTNCIPLNVGISTCLDVGA